MYPHGSVPKLSKDWEAIRTDISARKEWLQFFLLGASFTLGGVQQEQHRAFVEWCEQEGWLNAFADPNHQDRSYVTESLKDYLERSTDHLRFYYWMRLFVPLFQLSTWLEEYALLFLRLEHQQQPINLQHFLAPNANPRLGGGGLSAPPLQRTLGLRSFASY